MKLVWHCKEHIIVWQNKITLIMKCTYFYFLSKCVSNMINLKNYLTFFSNGNNHMILSRLKQLLGKYSPFIWIISKFKESIFFGTFISIVASKQYDASAIRGSSHCTINKPIRQWRPCKYIKVEITFQIACIYYIFSVSFWFLLQKVFL